MLATFEKEKGTSRVYVMEIITGVAICFCVFIIGITMIHRSKREINDV